MLPSSRHLRVQRLTYAFHIFPENGNYAILPALLESGCPLDAGDANGATPIHYAVQHTSEPTVDELGTVYATI